MDRNVDRYLDVYRRALAMGPRRRTTGAAGAMA